MQPLHSGIISIPGSPKTWTWNLSPILPPRLTENHKIVPKVGPKRLPKSNLKSIKVDTGPQCVHWVSPWTPGSPKWCPRYPKKSLQVSKITVLSGKSDPFQQSTCQQLPVDRRGRRQGAKLLNAPRLGSTLPSTACQTIYNVVPTSCQRSARKK